MKMTFRGGSLSGSVSTPPSKSHTHRAFFLAAMAKGHSVIENVLLSEDTKATLRACEAMGAKVTVGEGRNSFEGATVTIDGGELHAPEEIIYAANSGTTMRLMAGIASMFDKEITIDGDASLRKRPIKPLLDSLAMAGVKVGSEDGYPPITVQGPNNGGHIDIDGSVSSQFLTAILITAPMLENDTELVAHGDLISDPYLDLTQEMMKKAGAHSKRKKNTFTVRGGSGYLPFSYHVPADFSSAAFALVGGALNGDNVTVTDMDMTDPQGDRRIVDILKTCGADIHLSGSDITVSKGQIRAQTLDMGNTPDLFPIVAVLLSTAKGTSTLKGAPQLRLKESDRIKTTVTMLKALGADIDETDDGCIIHGKERLAGGTVDSFNDHRIMMSAAIASIVCNNPVVIENADCYSISYPDFPEEMKSIGMNIEV